MTKPPPNPALWLGYHLARYEKTAETSSFAAGLVGSGVVSSNPAFGAPCIVVASLVFGLLLYWRHESASLDETHSARDLLLEESLSPLLEELASTADQPAPYRKRTADRLADRACGRLARAFDSIPGVRVCVFTISDDAQRMNCSAARGRDQQPKSFERGSARGDKAFKVLEMAGPYRFAADLDQVGQQEEWDGSGDGYRTFITAPIRSLEKGFGLLTIDAPRAGDLDDRHGQTIALYASALAVAYAEAKRGELD